MDTKHEITAKAVEASRKLVCLLPPQGHQAEGDHQAEDAFEHARHDRWADARDSHRRAAASYRIAARRLLKAYKLVNKAAKAHEKAAYDLQD